MGAWYLEELILIGQFMLEKKENYLKSINKAIKYLIKNQLSTGEFKTIASSKKSLRKGMFDSSNFTTANVLYCLKDINTENMRYLKNQACKFLLHEQEESGVWKYWTKITGKKIEPDLDDTALISYILKTENISFRENRNKIQGNVNENGIF